MCPIAWHWFCTKRFDSKGSPAKNNSSCSRRSSVGNDFVGLRPQTRHALKSALYVLSMLLFQNPVTRCDAFRDGGTGIQRAFHVADEFIAGVFAREVQPAFRVVEQRTKARDLARRRK